MCDSTAHRYFHAPSSTIQPCLSQHVRQLGDLRKLPREVRDVIYKFALMRDEIEVTQTPSLESPRFCRSRHRGILVGPLPVHTPPQLRSTFSSGTAWKLNSTLIDVTGVKTSYRLEVKKDDPPSLHVFLVSQQIYAETFPIFYNHNAFVFSARPPTKDVINTCLAFLYDRPLPALRCIREVRIELGWWSFSSLDYVLAQEPKWHVLCEELGTFLSLHTLDITIRGEYIGHPVSSAASAGDGGLERIWTRELHNITGLRKLVLKMHNMRTLEENAKFIQYLGATMMKST